MPRLTIAAVTAAIQPIAPGCELIKGEGYFYFIGPELERAREASVYVTRLTDLTLERWVAEAAQIMATVEPIAEPGTFTGIRMAAARSPSL